MATNKESKHLLEIGSNIEESLRTKLNVILEKNGKNYVKMRTNNTIMAIKKYQSISIITIKTYKYYE